MGTDRGACETGHSLEAQLQGTAPVRRGTDVQEQQEPDLHRQSGALTAVVVLSPSTVLTSLTTAYLDRAPLGRTLGPPGLCGGAPLVRRRRQGSRPRACAVCAGSLIDMRTCSTDALLSSARDAARRLWTCCWRPTLTSTPSVWCVLIVHAHTQYVAGLRDIDDATSQDLRTPLHSACRTADGKPGEECVRTLITAGAEVNAKTHVRIELCS